MEDGGEEDEGPVLHLVARFHNLKQCPGIVGAIKPRTRVGVNLRGGALNFTTEDLMGDKIQG